MFRKWFTLTLLLLCCQAFAEDETSWKDYCEADGGPWSCLLNEWAVTSSASMDTHCRRGRVMSLPPTKGYYVTDRIDFPPPPPPPHHAWHGPPHGHINMNVAIATANNGYGSSSSYNYQWPPPPPSHSPQKRVTETDLYLLTAIEKLVFRVDLMETRLRKMEESVHYLVAGKDAQPEPCPEDFTRVGTGCYHFSADSLDWKSANLRCRMLKANLVELQTDEERRQIHSALLADERRRGEDWWTGGLNPGLLWIWSHSARPVLNDTRFNATSTQTAHSIAGDGRCLALAHAPHVSAYVYRGQDCAARMRYVCEREDDAARLSNEIEKTAKQLEDTSAVLPTVVQMAKQTVTTDRLTEQTTDVQGKPNYRLSNEIGKTAEQLEDTSTVLPTVVQMAKQTVTTDRLTEQTTDVQGKPNYRLSNEIEKTAKQLEDTSTVLPTVVQMAMQTVTTDRLTEQTTDVQGKPDYRLSNEIEKTAKQLEDTSTVLPTVVQIAKQTDRLTEQTTGVQGLMERWMEIDRYNMQGLRTKGLEQGI